MTRAKLKQRVLHRGKQILIAADQLLNACTPGGWADETFSSRCWRKREEKIWKWLHKVIDRVAAWLGDLNHCEESYKSERTGAQLPPELRPKL